VTPPAQTELALATLARLGVARSRDLEQAGLSRTAIRRLLEQGVIEQVGRGLYRDPAAPVPSHLDLAAACQRVPGGVVCLLSALRFHGLTTENPFEVWLAIEGKAWRAHADHPPLRLVHMSGASLRTGVEHQDLEGAPLRVFSAAKTVADCFKFRHKIGVDVAVEALRDYHRLHPKRLDALWRFAEVDRVTRVMRPYLESLA
jgi:predicted transcriptional regulator of viral defense system